jgi:multicomponent Na+:H+ antiporter subunit A
MGGLPAVVPPPDLSLPEWGVILIAMIGIATVVSARTRLFAILALGIQGIAVALLYLLFGAPDLSFTQFMVEILSVVILTLVMTRLRLDHHDQRPFEDLLRDGGLALVCGLGVTALLFAVLGGTLDPRLSDFFNANSAPVAHGRNIVNVILVDFRGLDTLGEISVVMTAGIAILALIRSARKTPLPPAPEDPRPARRRRAEQGASN